MNWHFAVEGKDEGPVTEAELADLFRSGSLSFETLVWNETYDGWIQAGEVPRFRKIYVTAGGDGLGGMPSVGVATYVPAGLFQRGVAFVIDLIILTILAAIVGGIYELIFSVSEEFAEDAGGMYRLVIGWLYFSLLESSPAQGTAGKMIVGIKVTDMEGRRIGFLRASGRHFAKILSTCFFLIGYLMIAFTEKKQGLHDMLTGCLVVNRD